MIVEPNVQLLAHTVINDDVIAELMDIQPQSTDAETLVTFAGRSCYESWHRPRPETYHDKDILTARSSSIGMAVFLSTPPRRCILRGLAVLFLRS